jgi:hypothetical protein
MKEGQWGNFEKIEQTVCFGFLANGISGDPDKMVSAQH